MLKYENVCFAYDDRKVLNNLTFTVKEGEQVALIGANGAGKTTLLKATLGIFMPEGEILVKGIGLERDTLSKLRKIIGYVSSDSDSQLFMSTVMEDMIFGPINYGISKDEAVKIAREIVEKLDMSGLEERKNMSLSSGEKRIAAIATILTMQPEIILLDEPSSNLDYHHRRILINTLNNLKITKIIATHDLDFVLETCDRVILINNGTIVADGDTLDILTNKKLLEENGLELPFCIAGLPVRCKDKL